MTIRGSDGLAAVSYLGRATGDERLMRGGIVAIAGFLVVTLVLPLYVLMSKSLHDATGTFVGLANFISYFSNPALYHSIFNSVAVASVSTAITIVLAFVYAYAITHACIRGKETFRIIAMIPLLAPSLLPAISLTYLFGNKGMLKALLLGETIYGPIGIVISLVFAMFPHAFIIINTGLSLSDGRLYEASQVLKASRIKTFLAVTLPAAKYGLISATFVVFTHAITDFGIPKVIGGQFNVLATDIYKQVIGQQNFEMGAVISVVLLLPAVAALVIDKIAHKGQIAFLSTHAVAFEPKPSVRYDGILFAICATIAFAIVAMIAVAAYGSVIKFWPYDLSFTMRHYQFDLYAGGGWAAYFNSLKLALLTAVFGTAIVFVGAYLVEKSGTFARGRAFIQILALMPMAVPGLVLGLAYIFFFNHPDNPLTFLYGTMAILVMVTIGHYYTVTHLTALTALKQLDKEFESVSDSLKASRLKTFGRVTVPICLPAILDISVYFFLSAMTTVSAVVFLYSVHTQLAAIAVLNMDDAGEQEPAAAMAIIIVITCVAMRVLHFVITRRMNRRAQAWKKR